MMQLYRPLGGYSRAIQRTVLLALSVVAGHMLISSGQAAASPYSPISSATKGKTGPQLTLITQSPGHSAANGDSVPYDLSADGRYLFFHSWATNLMEPGISNGLAALSYVYDRQSGRIAILSRDGEGEPVRNSRFPRTNGKGTVSVLSTDTAAHPQDVNGSTDIYLTSSPFVTQDQTFIPVSVRDGTSSLMPKNGESLDASLSDSGRRIAFQSSSTDLHQDDSELGFDVYLRDVDTKTTELVSVSSSGVKGNAPSGMPEISSDGKLVVFASVASNLVAGDRNGRADIFMRDLRDVIGVTTTRRITVSQGGEEANGDSWSPEIDSSGRYTVFVTTATNLFSHLDQNGSHSDIVIYDSLSGEHKLVSVSSLGVQANGPSDDPRISRDGRYITYASFADNLVPGDTNGKRDIFRYDRQTAETVIVSRGSEGRPADGHSGIAVVSGASGQGGGGAVAFNSYSGFAENDNNQLADIYLFR